MHSPMPHREGIPLRILVFNLNGSTQRGQAPLRRQHQRRGDAGLLMRGIHGQKAPVATTLPVGVGLGGLVGYRSVGWWEGGWIEVEGWGWVSKWVPWQVGLLSEESIKGNGEWNMGM